MYLESVNVAMMCLPAYSPDLPVNPIKNVFSCIEHRLNQYS